jgi:F0F1-type ATP synthase assembly protein I
MTQKPTALPIDLLLLDFIGALMVALGLVETTDPGAFLDTERWISGYNWFLIAVGILLMLPMVLHMVKRAREKASGNKVQTVDRK